MSGFGITVIEIILAGIVLLGFIFEDELIAWEWDMAQKRKHKKVRRGNAKGRAFNRRQDKVHSGYQR